MLHDSVTDSNIRFYDLLLPICNLSVTLSEELPIEACPIGGLCSPWRLHN